MNGRVPDDDWTYVVPGTGHRRARTYHGSISSTQGPGSHLRDRFAGLPDDPDRAFPELSINFAGWVARGCIGHPMLDGINYWDELKDSPSQMEICFAVFANVLELDDQGEPVNEKYAERRAALWLYQYCTGLLPPGEAELEGCEVALYC